MSHSVEELRSLPRDELITRHDAVATPTSVGVNYYLEELARRDAAEQTAEMVRLTRRVARLTMVITVLTAANVIAVIVGVV